MEPEYMKTASKDKKLSDKDKGGKEYQPPMYTGDKKNPTKTKVTLFGVGAKVIMLTQQRLARKGIVPKDLDEFRRQVYYTLSLIHPNQHNLKDTLQNHAKTYNEMRDMKSKDRALVVMPFIGVKVHEVESNTPPYSYNIPEITVDANFNKEKNPKEIEYKIKCSEELINRAMQQHSNVRINGANSSREQDAFKTMAFGYVRFNRRGKMYGLEFTDLAFIPISKRGLWVESEYERHLFNYLTDNNIVFYKPHESFEYYHDLTPDIMIQNPNHPEEWMLCEIFGRTEPDYIERKEKKIKRMKEIESEIAHINTWHWDATTDPNDIPDIVGKDFTLSIPDFERKKRS